MISLLYHYEAILFCFLYECSIIGIFLIFFYLLCQFYFLHECAKRNTCKRLSVEIRTHGCRMWLPFLYHYIAITSLVLLNVPSSAFLWCSLFFLLPVLFPSWSRKEKYLLTPFGTDSNVRLPNLVIYGYYYVTITSLVLMNLLSSVFPWFSLFYYDLFPPWDVWKLMAVKFDFFSFVWLRHYCFIGSYECSIISFFITPVLFHSWTCEENSIKTYGCQFFFFFIPLSLLPWFLWMFNLHSLIFLTFLYYASFISFLCVQR